MVWKTGERYFQTLFGEARLSLGQFFEIYIPVLSSNFTPQVKEARNQSQFFNRKSSSRNTTHRQAYHLQAMLTGVKRRKANTRSE